MAGSSHGILKLCIQQEGTALTNLSSVKDKWGVKYPYAINSWENNWDVKSKWTQRYHNWDQVLNQLLIIFEDRLEKYI
ncbi:hypothetical protein [Alkaliphilus metalliredigens]|uniref:hypothetical protein n=1 Tax=Alkaliphilus metalliredigens TaxID=208226 RepID=UPI0005A0D7A2